MGIIGKTDKIQVNVQIIKDKTGIKTLKIRKDVGRNPRSRTMEKNLKMIFSRNTIKMVGLDNSKNPTKFGVTLEEKIRTIISTHLQIISNSPGSKRIKINSRCLLVP